MPGNNSSGSNAARITPSFSGSASANYIKVTTSSTTDNASLSIADGASVAGRVVYIKASGSSSLTVYIVNGNATVSSVIIPANTMGTFVSDGTNWN
ncbi:hypothetical protein [Hymenobacter negativus]|uniref:Uncharacterized protein n=1 Tax=Hymenobacter negativus TaxID=2795026 RepID=A0ABS0QE75_9BACT|nr:MULTISPECIES: hypothetical protein [Bacteria]MBH8560486.1 hypothetical protein [Hymenobacter negativus]